MRHHTHGDAECLTATCSSLNVPHLPVTITDFHTESPIIIPLIIGVSETAKEQTLIPVSDNVIGYNLNNSERKHLLRWKFFKQ